MSLFRFLGSPLGNARNEIPMKEMSKVKPEEFNIVDNKPRVIKLEIEPENNKERVLPRRKFLLNWLFSYSDYMEKTTDDETAVCVAQKKNNTDFSSSQEKNSNVHKTNEFEMQQMNVSIPMDKESDNDQDPDDENSANNKTVLGRNSALDEDLSDSANKIMRYAGMVCLLVYSAYIFYVLFC